MEGRTESFTINYGSFMDVYDIIAFRLAVALDYRFIIKNVWHMISDRDKQHRHYLLYLLFTWGFLVA